MVGIYGHLPEEIYYIDVIQLAVANIIDNKELVLHMKVTDINLHLISSSK